MRTINIIQQWRARHTSGSHRCTHRSSPGRSRVPRSPGHVPHAKHRSGTSVVDVYAHRDAHAAENRNDATTLRSNWISTISTPASSQRPCDANECSSRFLLKLFVLISDLIFWSVLRILHKCVTKPVHHKNGELVQLFTG
jgi:hypothetical protein